jgi:hypothetical protein
MSVYWKSKYLSSNFLRFWEDMGKLGNLRIVFFMLQYSVFSIPIFPSFFLGFTANIYESKHS